MGRYYIIPLLLLYGHQLYGATERCFYQDATGAYVAAQSIEEVPSEFKSHASCNKVRTGTKAPKYAMPEPRSNKSDKLQRNTKHVSGKILAPDEVELDGVTRRITLSSRFGTVLLQWQTNTERLFGKSPRQSVKAAWQAGARTLATNPFPFFLREDEYNWNIVFMDEDATQSANPFKSGGCHPGWITPPANIYISANRIVDRCDPSKKPLTGQRARDALNRTLVHEFGHAVEYKLLGPMARKRQRYHSEGFAEWFETLGSSKLLGESKLSIRSELRKQAKEHFTERWNPKSFDGSHTDYIRAYAMIATIAEKRSIRRLMEIYEHMRAKRVPFAAAVETIVGWDMKKWKQETAKHLQ